MSNERIYEAYSRRNPETGSDVYGSCQLIVGDGSDKITFDKGRALIPERLIPHVESNADIHIPEIHGAANASERATLIAAAGGPPLDPAEELALLRARMAELEEQEAAREGRPSPTPAVTSGQVDPAALAAAADGQESEEEEKLRLAKEYLEAEGEEVPEVEVTATPNVTLNPGLELEPLTSDNQPRCQAVKGDGSQCSNPATYGEPAFACGLQKHQEQLSPAS